MGGLLLDGVAHYETDPNRATCRRCRYSGNAGDWRIIARLRNTLKPLLQMDPATGMVTEVGRDPELRKAALDLLLAWREHRTRRDVLIQQNVNVIDESVVEKAMAALREAMAK